MPDAIESFVAAQNIRRYKTLLKEETNGDRRRTLLRLLERELAKFPEAAKRVELIRAGNSR